MHAGLSDSPTPAYVSTDGAAASRLRVQRSSAERQQRPWAHLRPVSLYVKVSVRPLRRVCVPGASKQRTVLSTRLAEQHPVIFFLTRRRLETAGSTENTQACQWACLWEARSCCLPDTSAGDAGHTGDTHRVQPGSWSKSRQRRRSGCVTVMGAAPSSPPSRPSPVSPGGSDSGSDMAVCVLQERGTKRGAEWRPVVEK